MSRTRIRTKGSARRYVARNVAAMLDADFANASEWMHQCSFHGEDGNLDGAKSEQLVHAFSRGKKSMRLYVKTRINVGNLDERDDYREATDAEYLEVAKTMYHCGRLPCEKCGHLGTWSHLQCAAPAIVTEVQPGAAVSPQTSG